SLKKDTFYADGPSCVASGSDNYSLVMLYLRAGFGSFLALSMLCAWAPSASGPELSSTQSALIDCVYLYDLNETDIICHATGSATNPYVLVKTSEAGCINGHSAHPGDYIEVPGGNCKGSAICTPDESSCGPSLPGCC